MYWKTVHSLSIFQRKKADEVSHSLELDFSTQKSRGVRAKRERAGEGGGKRAKDVYSPSIFFTPRPPPSCFFRFALASSSLAVLTARSSIEKHEKIEGCGQSSVLANHVKIVILYVNFSLSLSPYAVPVGQDPAKFDKLKVS